MNSFLSATILILSLFFNQPAVNNSSPNSDNIENTPEFTKIVAGEEFTCGLSSSGGVFCTGRNEYGQVGDGTTLSRSGFVSVVGLDSHVTDIVAGAAHACALTDQGGMMCWGLNLSGQLGNNSGSIFHSTPIGVSGLASGVKDITAGSTHTCAVLESGGAMCWGENTYGQLGNGTTNGSSTPVAVNDLQDALEISAGGIYSCDGSGHHTCALTSTGGVKCWGMNYYGQLGNGEELSRSQPEQVIGLETGVSSVVTGGTHTCALLSSGGMKCWGNNQFGQLGEAGTVLKSSLPVDVIDPGNDIERIYANAFQTCASSSGGGLKCWGRNHHGQLGDGTPFDRNLPVDVFALEGDIQYVAPGYSHTCAAMLTGETYCWGRNFQGELSDGADTMSYIPLDVAWSGETFTAIDSWYMHNCAITTGGTVKCWGRNDFGQLGDGSTTDRTLPVDLQMSDFTVSLIRVGYLHSCLITDAGGAKCWGSNGMGQLGDGTGTDSPAPVSVTGLETGIQHLDSGLYHSCAVSEAGSVKCWGGNSDGQLGDGTYYNRFTPVEVSGLSAGVAAVTTGEYFSCVLMDTGGVKCWGDNWAGQLGNGATDDSPTPVDVIELNGTAVAISAGGHHVCALMDTGGVKCWGFALGPINITPVDIAGLEVGVAEVSAGGNSTCVVMDNGQAKCWGINRYGGLGTGSYMDPIYAPLDVYSLAQGVSHISPGYFHTCAIVGGGRLKCSGWDGYGQMGTGRTLRRLLPVMVVDNQPSLRLNYEGGQPGSFFTLTGTGFEANRSFSILANDVALSGTFTTTESGDFTVFIDTSAADSGYYELTPDIQPDIKAGFSLRSQDPIRVQEGGGELLNLPGGIGVLHADFNSQPTSGVSPLLAEFTNLSSGEFDTCAWDFGDGSSSSACADPSHTYTTHGTYTVTLTVNGLGGMDSEAKTEFITAMNGDEAVIEPTLPESLVYTDTQGSLTSLVVPAGAVIDTTLLVISQVTDVTPPNKYVFADHAFDLQAYQEDDLLTGFTFEQPVTVTIAYSDGDLVNLDEVTLKLYWWDASLYAWVAAVDGSYQHNSAENWISVPILYSGRFALFGIDLNTSYLPGLWK